MSLSFLLCKMDIILSWLLPRAIVEKAKEEEEEVEEEEGRTVDE